MGEVWRARDTRLDRSVAIKVLPRELAQNTQFKVRFEREAKAISQLNHPNICTLHDVGEEKGTSYLVMELLEGESLADRIEHGPMPLVDVLRYGIQIADGLDRAHRAGIVHRDLKPGNVMITRSGAKLLDFGLAKSSGAHVVEPPPPDSETELRADMTNRTPLTAEGTIIGTFQYMAPEQLEGTPADTRTDIFALGAVLYEMATGRRAFQGKTRTSLIAAIVSAQPPAITNVQPLAPTALDHVISTCLAKDPDDRWQSAHDVAQELRWIETSGSAVPAVAHRSSRLWMALVAVGLIGALVLAALYVRERSRAEEPVSFSIIAPRGYSIDFQALSPDGKAVVFIASNSAGEQSIWVRRLDSVDAVRISDAAPGLNSLFWSPDSKWIGFYDRQRIMKVSVQGGAPETICSNCVSYGVGAAWGNDGTILFAPRFAEGLFRVPASGGVPVRVTSIDASRRETLNGYPSFFGDGDHFVYLVRTVADVKSDIVCGSLSTKTKVLIGKADALVGFWKKNLLFVRDGAMYGQPFDVAAMKLTGEPRKVLDNIFYDEDSASSGATVATNGALLYVPSTNWQRKTEVGWYDRGGRMVGKLFDDVSVGGLALSPDDSRIAMAKVDPRKGARDIWVYDINRGVRTKVTSGLSNHANPTWTPDGQRIIFASDGDGMYDIYSQPDDGTTSPQPVWKGGDDKHPMSVSRDGQTLLATLFSATTRGDLWTVPLNGQGKPAPLIASEGSEGDAAFSPDGHWVAYASGQSGKEEIYVRAFPSGRSVQVSVDGGHNPLWSTDGSEIYFVTSDANQFAASFRGSGGVPELGKPELLFHGSRTMTLWIPSHKPGRYLGAVRSAPEEIDVINFTTGWTEKLEH
ncbi:MAG: eukaryotic-like serine/threonine-protein kinase [Thermoanaerobaculia bacterium]|jgi:serine/threonine protein kinase/WD40 repeat protein|nr:eukaryotic-like serine/threonine-protein kinase [Thermoanaerobaculia bacterium]